jgi:hypothetical protein
MGGNENLMKCLDLVFGVLKSVAGNYQEANLSENRKKIIL